LPRPPRVQVRHRAQTRMASVSSYPWPMSRQSTGRRTAGTPRAAGLTVPLAAIALALAGAAAAEPVRVAVVPLGEVLFTREHSAPATVVARNAPQLAAEVDARVVRSPVQVGDRVSADQLLAALDCRSLEARLASAQASLTSAEARQRFAGQQLKRARDLREKRSISEELLDQRQNEVAVAQAERAAAAQAVALARIDVDNCEVRAPFDAIVTERMVGVGDYVTRGKPLFALVEAEGQEVTAEIRHDQVDSLLAADRVRFDTNGRRFPLRLRSLVAVADALARTREARLAFSGPSAIVGSAGRLTWPGEERLLPAEFLVRRDERTGVFVLQDGAARFVPLPDAQHGRPAAVTLPRDSLLITEGRQALVEGTAVVVRETTGTADP
jgi:RND family efflux transporter MFP subunit